MYNHDMMTLTHLERCDDSIEARQLARSNVCMCVCARAKMCVCVRCMYYVYVWITAVTRIKRTLTHSERCDDSIEARQLPGHRHARQEGTYIKQNTAG